MAFITQDGGLTTSGYVLAALVIFALLVIGSIVSKQKKAAFDAKCLAFCAVSLALATVTSMIKLFDMPMGGAVTLLSMFFICLIGYLYGPVIGITTGVAYGLLQMVMDPYIISLPQLLIDYPLAFGALGLSGFFADKKYGLVIGYVVGIIGRFIFSVISGVVFFAMYAPENMSPLVYSAAYNGGYIFTEGIITVIILLIPVVANGIKEVKRMANS